MYGVLVNMAQTSLCMWLSVRLCMYICHRLTEFTPLCNVVNILS